MREEGCVIQSLQHRIGSRSCSGDFRSNMKSDYTIVCCASELCFKAAIWFHVIKVKVGYELDFSMKVL